MKKLLFVFLLSCVTISIYAAGLVLNRFNVYVETLPLVKSHYEVRISDEMAVVKLSEVYRVAYTHQFYPRYFFPMAEGAATTSIRWKVAGVWHSGQMSIQSQHPAGGPSQFSQGMQAYLGEYPFVYDILPSLNFNDTLIVELTYIQPVTYRSGNNDLVLKNNISFYQSYQVEEQSLEASLYSTRDIYSLDLVSHAPDEVDYDDHTGNLNCTIINQPAGEDYLIRYCVEYLHPVSYQMSTFQNSVPDSLGRGYFAFHIEPDPLISSLPIRKVYTIVIDNSGSMNADNKLVQAQQASNYMVDNLNPDDYFNIISFNSLTVPLWNQHRPFSQTNVGLAHDFINNLEAETNTNMQNLFYVAINQFAPTVDSVANVIIFMTDGEPTEGIGGTNELSQYVDNLVLQTGAGIFLFSFGIGPNINEDLLNLLSEHNQGIAMFVGIENIYSAITNFYNNICNPLLVNPIMNIEPFSTTTEVYPDSLQNLYLGQQRTIYGRYSVPQTLQLVLTGNLFNQDITYQFQSVLSGVENATYNMLPKMWAKKKIEELLREYYTYLPTDPQALALKLSIYHFSVMYSIQTIFEGTITPVNNLEEYEQTPSFVIRLINSYPNPFSKQTNISFKTGCVIKEPVILKIYNTKGQLVKTLTSYTKTPGDYELSWDGRDNNGNNVASGVYIYKITAAGKSLTNKLMLMK